MTEASWTAFLVFLICLAPFALIISCGAQMGLTPKESMKSFFKDKR